MRPTGPSTVSSLAHALPTRELVLDRYRAVRPLGSGGNGSVWLAKDEVTGLDVALKIIPREGKAAARAEREALAARRLRHERCVRAYDVGHDAGHVYIAYEYVPGRTVRDALRADDVSDAGAVEIAAQVLDALAHAHRTGIVHRDVKPSNVLLQHGDAISVRLLDFGLAQFDGADTLTAVGDVPGTLAYIAPERLAGEEAGPASDVWAVGVMLWEALAGRHPFWGMPLQEVARAIERGAPPLVEQRPDLPRRLVTAVETALAPEPAERPHASVFAGELRASLRAPQARAASRRARNPAAAPAVPGVSVRPRVAPAVLAGIAAALGVTMLPFWPPALQLAIVVAAASAAFFSPRLGLAVVLAAPVFAFGNVAEGAAILYGTFAISWMVLCWREARLGLLFVAGPLLGWVGALALVPLVVQPVRGTFLRAAQGALAVLSAILVAALAGESPVGGDPLPAVDVVPSDSVQAIALDLGRAVVDHPVLAAATFVVAFSAAVLPWARRRSRYGLIVVGIGLCACTVAAGAGIASTLLVVGVWSAAALLAARTGR